MNGLTGNDVLVVGGGPAGAAAAIALARHGLRVCLAEREQTARHKVCGEFLSAEALILLEKLGLPLQEVTNPETAAVSRVRLASMTGRVTETVLPFAAGSVSRCTLDAALLRAASYAGVQVLRGRSVRELGYSGGMWRAAFHDGSAVRARRAILANGKHDLHGFSRPAGAQNDLVGLKMYFALRPEQEAALAGAVELLLHPEGYTGLQMVEGVANCTALVSRQRLMRIGGWQGLLKEITSRNPHASERLTGATPLLERPLAISSLPYGYVRPHAAAYDLWSVGDQCAVIPSFTGDGMSIALYTGLRAAEGIARGESCELFQEQMDQLLRPQVRRATLLSRALVKPFAGSALTRLAAWWPAGFERVAARTRLPESALRNLEVPEEHTAGHRVEAA